MTAGASVAASPSVDAAASGEATERGSYRQILSSSAWIGGASVLNLAIGIVRTKIMAMLLGPAGFGLMGTFTAIVDLVRAVAEMGINNSGVRQIADAAASGDAQRVARTATVLRRTAWALGIGGAVLLIAMAGPIAELTFGDRTHVGAVALLSLAVLLRLVADAHAALVQGLRRIADVAKIGVIAALCGTAVSVPLVYWLRVEGVALALAAVAAATAAASWRYSRKARIEHAVMPASVAWQEASALLQLGVAFMASGLLMMGAAYIVRLIMIRQLGLDAAGLYQAAWTLGGLYVGMVLQAMGTDFYPRLVGVAKDHAACNRIVNEQTHVSLLLAGTGVLGTIGLSPWAVTLLYTAEFAVAAEPLRWICLGMALRVVSWPLGYVIIARGDRGLFFGAELAWAVVNVGLSWLFVGWYGVAGAGIAFFASYMFHIALVYTVVNRLTGFRWSATNLKALVLYAAVIAVAAGAFHLLPTAMAMGVAVVVAAVAAGYAFLELRRLTTGGGVPSSIRRFMNAGA
jgi:enterobacterial common antigen flippase